MAKAKDRIEQENPAKVIDHGKTLPGQMGRSERKVNGPEAGDGAVVHENSGEADFDGRGGDELPPRKAKRENSPGAPS